MRREAIWTAFQEASITGGISVPVASGRAGKTEKIRNVTGSNRTQHQIRIRNWRTGCFL